MSLSSTLANALSGMNAGQKSLQVLSRNVANAGTPGYHRQSLRVIDTTGINSSYARTGAVERAFDQSLQVHYTNAISESGYSAARVATLNRLQTFLGKPGSPGSLDTMFGKLQGALQALGTSPDNYATRATVVASAQAMATTLNSLTRDIQGLRQEAETQIGAAAEHLNVSIKALAKINDRLGDQSVDPATRATLMDQRDRLVGDISETIDLRVDYRPNGTVALMTRTGVGLLDGKVATFSFEPAGGLTADKLFNYDPDKSAVGRLMLTTASGVKMDLVQQGAVQSGRLGALIELRDSTLPLAQSQLDEIAAGLAQAMSTSLIEGTPASDGTQNGYTLDTAAIADGNDFLLTYTSDNASRTLRVVNVDDASKLPLDYRDANGASVVGVRFADGMAGIADAVRAVVGPGITVSTSGSSITVLDDGAGGTTDIGALTGRSTATQLRGGTPALNLFVDRGNAAFTDSLGGKPQKQGFAGRIQVNAAILTDNTLLVKMSPTDSLGTTTRPEHLLEQLQNMIFASAQTGPADSSVFRLGGTVSDLIAQTMNYTGNVAADAISENETRQLTMETVAQRLDDAYGVDVDEEMARLMELQNAYAANSRVISIVQELLQRLMDI